MNPSERVDSVLQGRQPDRPPVSFWYHFGPEWIAGQPAVEAHIRHAETYDLDFLKIMNDNRYPSSTLPSGTVSCAEDLDRLQVLNGDEEGFGRQLQLIEALAKRYAGELPMSTTIFHAWGTLRQLTAPETAQHRPPTLQVGADPRDAFLAQLLREAPEALQRALDVMAESLANFARHCLEAGADGIFLSVRDDRVDSPENGAGVYDRFVRAGDLTILGAAAPGSFNMLHVCGKSLNFGRFADYPVHAINWADRYAGPSISEVAGSMRPAICGGLDNLATMVDGSPEDCRNEVTDALHQAKGRPIMIGPGCTFDPRRAPAENLHAIRRAVDSTAAG